MALVYFPLLALLAVTHASIPLKDLFNSLELTSNDIDVAYDGLNANRDKVINLDDLHIHYYQKDADFAKQKFMDLIDTRLKDGSVDKFELTDFLSKRSVTDAVWECTYVKSNSLKQYCFADQVLTYVLLVIDMDATHKFYDTIEKTNPDGVICPKDVAKLKDLVPSFDAEHQENFLREIGGDDNLITFEEFTEYVEKEDLQDNFRICRKDLQGFKGVYNYDCLIKKLVDYTMNDLTELDIAMLFDEYEREDDKSISTKDLIDGKVCDEQVAQKFIKLMDRTKDGVVSYAEFRTYLKTHTVKMHLQRLCTQVKKTQQDEIDCLKEQVNALVLENHTPIWMRAVDLDTVLLFEQLDSTKDGIIKVSDDLIKGRAWDVKAATKMVEEMDGRDNDKDVSLEEMMEYIAYPNMVYALNDCLIITRSKDRTACYEHELQDEITYMLEKTDVMKFFGWYDKDGNKKITLKEVEAKGITGDEADNMLVEMGMGDKEITYLEFLWFVRQQRISHMFKDCDKSPEALHPFLRAYLNDVMTELDTEQLYTLLDKDDNGELDPSDFGATTEAVVKLIQRMDSMSDDLDKTANFYEYWLYLNTPMQHPRKTYLEEECTKKWKNQKDELNCYAENIVHVK